MGVTNYLPNGMILQVVSLVWDVLRKRVASKESKETSSKSHHPILPQIGFHFLRVTMKWWLWKAKSQMLSPRQRPTQQGGDNLETSESTELGFNHKKRLPNRVRKLIPWCWERDQRNKKRFFRVLSTRWVRMTWKMLYNKPKMTWVSQFEDRLGFMRLRLVCNEATVHRLYSSYQVKGGFYPTECSAVQVGFDGMPSSRSRSWQINHKTPRQILRWSPLQKWLFAMGFFPQKSP